MIDRSPRRAPASPDRFVALLQAAPPPPRRRILVVDDAAPKWGALRRGLGGAADGFVIENFSTPGPGLCRRPDLVLWGLTDPASTAADLRMHVIRLDGCFPGVPVVAVSETKDTRFALRALRQGFRGYLPATLDPGVAVAGLRLVLAGGIFLPHDILDICGDMTSVEHGEAAGVGALALTGRETQVLDRLKRGLQNKIIAYELGISQSTVKVHVRSIMRKTAATNRTQVAYLTRQIASPPRVSAPAG